jgi:hypothetical protein
VAADLADFGVVAAEGEAMDVVRIVFSTVVWLLLGGDGRLDG